MVVQVKVTATMGDTYGISMDARIRVLPLNGFRRASAAISPRMIAPAVPKME